MNYFDENISICTPYDCQIHETQRESSVLEWFCCLIQPIVAL